MLHVGCHVRSVNFGAKSRFVTHASDACEEAHGAIEGESEQLAIHCMPCWKERGSKCIVCNDTPAQNGKAFAHRCISCVADGRDRAIAKAVDREAQEWLDAQAARPEQSWDGSEPALQLLLLPQPSSLPLAPYAQQPHALEPKHCRLCMQGLRSSGGASTPGASSAAGVDDATCGAPETHGYMFYIFGQPQTRQNSEAKSVTEI